MPGDAALLRLSPHEALERMRQASHRYLDVSTEREFGVGHPVGAYNVPLPAPGPDGSRDEAAFVRVVEACFGRDAPLVIGCRSGVRSVVAARALLRAGFTHVVEQRAGFDGARGPFGELLEAGWYGAGLPSAVEPEAGHDYDALRARAAKR